MKEKRVTKRAIFASLLSVAVCTSMLIGTSYAWFTDSVTSANNKIQSGTLKIDVQVKGGDTGYTDYKSIRDTSAPIFNYDKWEPGYTSWTNVKVLNDGNLAFKYTMRFTSDNDIANEPLAEVIDVYYSPTEIPKTTRPADLAATGLVKIGTLKDVFNGTVPAIDDNMLPNDPADYATIVLKMKESAGNAYQNQTLSAFDLQVMAMQYTYEKDTFGDDYDTKANGIPDHPEWGNLNTSASGKAVAGQDTVIQATGAKLTVPANGATDGNTVTFSVTPDTTGNNTITINDGQTQMVYEITVTGADDTTEKTVELDIGKGKTGVTVSHSGTAMDPTKYSYDSTTGILTITSATFSPFQIVFDKVAGTRTVATVAAFKEAIANANDVDTISISGTMQLDSDLSINRDVTIDGNGNAVIMEKPIHIGKNNKVTFKNTKFDTVKNNNNNASFIYADKLAGELVIKNCTFTDTQWDSIQITPVAGAVIKIENNIFNTTDALSNVHNGKSERYIHIQNTSPNRGEDITVSVVGNTFNNANKMRNTVIDIDYVGTDSQITFGKNVVNDFNVTADNLDGFLYICVGNSAAQKATMDTYAAFVADTASVIALS